ncbi:DUF6207 family protein [Streptomyces sp. NPDC017082]|uniref:DUF6207 family protein n=1 Tax=Streptomyces sp. NPDC017082 TaxID=3364974 RepID=UPI0037B206C5
MIGSYTERFTVPSSLWTSRPRTTPPFLALQGELAERWATATDDQTTRTPGEPGVRLRCYLDLRQGLPAVVGPTTGPITA